MKDLEDRADKEADAFGRHPVLTSIKWGGAAIVVILALTIVVSLISTGSVFFEAARAKIVAPAEVTKKVYDPNNIINQVSFFTTTCEDAGRDYANWKSNEADYQREVQISKLATNQGEATQANNAAQQLSTAVSGALQQLQQDAAEYDARSINYTANPVKSANLPYRITVPSNPTELSEWTPPQCG